MALKIEIAGPGFINIF
ncbi:MAG TPA: hypothetical protein DD638_08355, partial [Pasteurellaceae bacterium]|nr:hypothetical protein [Pasteurellaceae bacterium]